MSTNSTSEVMIELDELTKTFPGQSVPAVDKLSLTIQKGEIVVFVGPSGCGKTTSMELINRLIEPTSGRIILEGEDVTDAQVDSLRRRIGYVIQETGLFPHRTIAQNIATVPGMIGWKKGRMDERVDELLGLIGMEPSQYRDRFPKELSGGQRQRVGVARAMAADPPVMLMDEPFGAIDPITRERLQNEFLRLQAQIQKTVVFVTHDIDEAIKMGDKIVVLKEQSHIAQFASPEEILSSPADDYVSDFIGQGASLKRLNLTRIRDIEMATDTPTGTAHEELSTLRQRLAESPWSTMMILDDQHRPMRWVGGRDLNRANAGEDIAKLGLPATATVEPQATLSDALNELITSNGGVAIVVDGSGVFQGVVDIESILTAVRTMREENSQFYLAQKEISEAID
ncbi:ABC transporter ATP-binding protein [Ornithinimicrobium sp. Arc0846-15]|nr:ABC transporter ATP-binding protein [Ornithinimicrobium laminariae]